MLVEIEGYFVRPDAVRLIEPVRWSDESHAGCCVYIDGLDTKCIGTREAPTSVRDRLEAAAKDVRGSPVHEPD